MPLRVTEKERLKHKVLITLNDDQYRMLLDEAGDRNLAPSIIARLAFARGLPAIRRKRQSGCRENDCARRKGTDERT